MVNGWVKLGKIGRDYIIKVGKPEHFASLLFLSIVVPCCCFFLK